MALAISNVCRSKIVEFEVGSRAYYEKVAKHPTWPGGMSGITIGIGYDLGQHTAEQFALDWAGREVTSDAFFSPLRAVCGLKGTHAKWVLHTVESLSIPYGDAVAVFDQVALPRYIAMTEKAFPNCSQLPQDAFGALVDLVYNRGPDTTSLDDRRAEMRAIKLAMTTMNVAAIPGYLRSMKRLWPGSKGLMARREWEAATFETAFKGVAAPAIVPTGEPQVRPPIVASRPVLVKPPVVESSDSVSDELNERELERVRRQNR